jgi:hypothetical protein
MGATLKRKCCCTSCKVGAATGRWFNVSKVRPVGDTAPAHYTSGPYPRWDISNTDKCGTAPYPPAGTCGAWLQGGDLNGVSVQEIQDTVNDIMTCAVGVQNMTMDHNCYYNDNQTTVDLTQPKLFGAQWILAQKYWHGCFGWKSNDACAQNPNVGPDQTKYLQYSVNAQWTGNYVSWDGTQSAYNNGSYNGSNAVNRMTGIVTNSLSISQDGGQTLGGVTTVTIRNRNGVGFSLDATDMAISNSLSNKTVDNSNVDARLTIPPMHNVGDWYCDGQSGVAQQIYNAGGFEATGLDSNGQFFSVTWPVVGSEDNWSCKGSVQCYYNPSNDGVTWVVLGTTQISINFQRTNTSASYGYSWTVCDYVYHSIVTCSGSVNATLSNPYTAAQCYDDFLAALAAWDMSDLTLASFRTDEALAFAPLCIYDEVGPTAPNLVWLFTMDNLNLGMITDPNGNAPGSTVNTPGQHDGSGRAPGDPLFTVPVPYLTTFPQIPWVDPNNYIWKYPNGSYSQPTGFNGGATLLAPMRTGTIISHTLPGCDRHFWYNYLKMQREPTVVDGGDTFEWFADTHGDYSQPPLPPVAMRWMNNQEAQYDGSAFINNATPAPGNYPQAFLTQQGGVIKGAKFVQASQNWPAVNFGRPCGPDKYAVDQTTVCCINATGASQFTVKATGNAIPPGSAGGLAVNDFVIAEGKGVYKITGIAATGADGGGDPQWVISVAMLDTLPTGYTMGEDTDGGTHLGRLRWPNAPGICGRAAITTTYAAGVVTITPAGALPYLRLGAAGSSILVDIYDAEMNLLVSGAAVNRVSDSSYTLPSAALPTAAWMTGHGVNYALYSSASQKTGVHLEWTFNQRAAQSGYTTPPAWYGGIGGCLACAVTQFNYSSGACPAAIGIVPYSVQAPADTSNDQPNQTSQPPADGPVENFPNQELFAFPAVFPFDDLFGAFWQSAVTLTMPDPFYQQPFKPDCDVTADSPDSVNWQGDDGSCQADSETVTDGGATVYTRVYPHRPLVEALATVPAGATLPAGVTLLYDPAHNLIAPPYYPTGIPIGDASGNYASIETDWGFAQTACACIAGGGRFAAFYSTFVSC